MKWIRVAAAVVNQTPLDWDRNVANILAAIDLARKAGAQVLCLPELCLTGYGCEDAFLSPGVQRTALTLLRALVPETRDLIVSVGLPLEFHGGLYNAACLIAHQKILGFAAKQNLAGEGLHYEPRWFKPWPAGVAVTWQDAVGSAPLGDLVFECGPIRLGFEICEDAWVAQRPGRDLADRGVDLILNPSASHFAFGKNLIRRQFVLDGSRAFQTAYIYANLLGNEAGRAIFDGDAMIASCGQMLACGERFSYSDVQLTHAAIDIDLIRTQKIRNPSYRVDPDRTDAGLVTAEIALPVIQAPRSEGQGKSDMELDKYEEFTRAVSLGLWDYARKSRSRGFIVSLSGGADSAAIACLVAKMIEFAVAELGIREVHRKLQYDSRVASCDSVSALTRVLLTCVYQATRNSSSTTRNAAESVARALNATYHYLDVDGLVEQYTSMIGQAIGRPLTWQSDDIALQNIQARVRAPGVWMLANLSGALLVATSNRSEAAVGYATMDGDTCGGLAPIAGIDKAFLRRWLRWLETVGPSGSSPIPALSVINQQAPTAELRPPAETQTDERDLMPYDVLDAIERAAIRDKRQPPDVYQQLRVDFPQISSTDLLTWVQRFFRLWARNQWKRERFAPSFHLDDESLDPKTWCRYPILSGGFEREIQQMLSESGQDPS